MKSLEMLASMLFGALQICKACLHSAGTKAIQIRKRLCPARSSVSLGHFNLHAFAGCRCTILTSAIRHLADVAHSSECLTELYYYVAGLGGHSCARKDRSVGGNLGDREGARLRGRLLRELGGRCRQRHAVRLASPGFLRPDRRDAHLEDGADAGGDQPGPNLPITTDCSSTRRILSPRQYSFCTAFDNLEPGIACPR